jgi:hypothetical protein
VGDLHFWDPPLKAAMMFGRPYGSGTLGSPEAQIDDIHPESGGGVTSKPASREHG